MKARLFSALLLVVLVCSVAGAASVPSVTMLSTKSCPACAEMSKVLTQINSQYKGKISTAHVYLEDNPDIAKKYNVRYVPTLIFRDASGKTLAQEVGYRSVSEVIKVFQKAGVKI